MLLRGVNDKPEIWGRAIEYKGFKLSMTKTEYLECTFSNMMHEAKVEMEIDAQVLPKKGSFKYLGSIIKKDMEIDDVEQHFGGR